MVFGRFGERRKGDLSVGHADHFIPSACQQGIHSTHSQSASKNTVVHRRITATLDMSENCDAGIIF